MKKNAPYTIIEKFLRSLSAPTDTAKTQSAQDAKIAAQLKKFIDEIPGGFFIYRADTGKILYANRAVCHIFLCQTYEQFATLTGNTFNGMVYEEDRADVLKSIDEQIAQSQDDLDYVEYRIVRSDGVIRWVEDYGHFVRSQAIGDVFYVFIGDATDKINRRRALISENREKQKLQTKIEEYDIERKLIQKEHLQRLEVIEGLSVNYDSILYCDLDSDTVLPYRLSTRLQTLFDKRWQERSYRRFIADYVAAWVHPEDHDRVAKETSPARMREMLCKTKTYHVNYRSKNKNDTQFLQIRIVNVGKKNAPSQIVIGCRNVDEEILQEMKQRQLLQESLHAAQAADAAKSAFLSNMSHDMRTPLNAILGFTALARKNANDTDAVLRYLDKIDSAGKQMLQLTEQVLELSYLESQDDCVEETACDLADILTDVYRAQLPDARKKNITFSTDTFALRHEKVFADKDKLQQILLHLVTNAIKYTPCGGTVVLKAAEYAATDERVAYRISVTDNGIGIAKEAQERIFEPFERENNSTLTGVFGTGLGLTIARRLAKSMDGDIAVESAPQKGSTFTLSVSLRTNDTPDAPIAGAVDFSGVRILLAEDNILNLEIETEILQDLGFVVDTAANGQIAVQKVCDNPPGTYALVLMDIQMPVMDGREAARAIRALPDERSRVPIVALSANALESDKRASADCGMQNHLAKPIDVPLLRSALSAVLNRS